MPNINAPFGFRPVLQKGGEPYSGGITPYKIPSGYAANIGLQDLVKLISTGYVNAAAAADRVLGVLMGVEYVGSDGIPVKRNNWISGTTTLGGQDAIAYVMDDPDVLVEGRFGNSANVVTQASIGNTFPHFVGAPNAYGMSTSGVDVGTLNATAIQTFRLVSFSGKVDNDPASSWGIGRLMFLNHEFRATTGV